MADSGCAAVILAAGASTRLGQPKQLLRMGDESLLHRTARLALEAGCGPVFAVLGFEAETMRAELSGQGLEGFGLEIVVNENWQEGIGASLRTGMEAMQQLDRQPDSVLVLVCDQPRLTAEYLRTLIDSHQSARKSANSVTAGVLITASVYAGRAGVPAVFSSGLFSELAALSGDRGARGLIQAHGARVQGIPWPEGELDLDRPEDLATIER